MKHGRTLTELAQELERQAKAKRDFTADTRQVVVEPFAGVALEDIVAHTENTRGEVVKTGGLAMRLGEETFPIKRHALRQIGEKLKIPAKFVDRLAADHPDMLAYNVNKLFGREPKGAMVRTLDGNVRAFLSDKYRPLDNIDLAQAVLPQIINQGAAVDSCEVTESRLYIKASREDLFAEIPPPPGVKMGEGHTVFTDSVKGGITVSNSEIGMGRLGIQPTITTQRCSNLASFGEHSFFKVHLGRKTGGGDIEKVWEYFSDKTKRDADAVVWNQVNDLVLAALDGTIFEKIVAQLTAARTDEMTRPVPEIMEITEKKFGLNQEETGGILGHLIKGGELTRYGLHNAVTRFSQDIEDYDRATELEALGGKLIEMPQTEWKTMALEIPKAA